MGEKVEKIEEGAVLWAEDECAPDAESIYTAWKRLFGEALNTENAVRVADYGDAMLYEMPGGYIATISYPGNTQITAPPRRVPDNKVQAILLQPGKDASLFDLSREEIGELRPIDTRDHRYIFCASSNQSEEGHYAKNRSHYGSGDTFRGWVYIVGREAVGLDDEVARRLLIQYKYAPSERLEWAVQRLSEQPADADPYAFNTIGFDSIRWFAQEAYGKGRKCTCGGTFSLWHEQARDAEYGFDLGSYEAEVCDSCNERLYRLSELERQEQRKALRALRLKPLSGELLISARKSLGVSREHMARALRVTPRDIIAWEEMDDFSKAPVQWLIDQLAATGVWG